MTERFEDRLVDMVTGDFWQNSSLVFAVNRTLDCGVVRSSIPTQWIYLPSRMLTPTHFRTQLSKLIYTSCSRAAATICPRPGLQRKRAAAALSQAGRAGPDQPIRAIQPAGHTRRAPTGCTRQTTDRQTSDVRQHHRLMPPGRGHNNLMISDYRKFCK